MAGNGTGGGRPELVGTESFGSVGLGGKERFYGELGTVGKGSSRVISSGADAVSGARGGIRAREVSGKVVEEGRAEGSWMGSWRGRGVAI